jgi:hypothetical protein
MTNSSKTQLTAVNMPIKSWFQEVIGTNKTALVGGFGPFINTMIMINASRKLMEHKNQSKG